MNATVRRIAVGVALGGLVVGCLLVGRLPVAILVGVLAVLGVDELLRLVRARGAHPVPIAAFLGTAGLVALAYTRGERGVLNFPAVLAASVAVTAFSVMLRKGVEGAAAAISSTTLAVVYGGLFPAYFVVLLALPWGRALAFGLAVMVVAGDVGSFALGKKLGKRPLAPSVSPGKTWEGLVGGVAATLAAGATIGMAMSPPFGVERGLILAAVVAVAGPAGDLVESMLKRDFAVKDSGTLLPGHGGVLDRIDGFLLAAPLFFYAYRALIR